MPKFDSKVRKRKILCGESLTGSVQKSIKARPVCNVMVDGWAGVFNPVPHPLPHTHTTAVPYV